MITMTSEDSDHGNDNNDDRRLTMAMITMMTEDSDHGNDNNDDRRQ